MFSAFCWLQKAPAHRTGDFVCFWDGCLRESSVSPLSHVQLPIHCEVRASPGHPNLSWEAYQHWVSIALLCSNPGLPWARFNDSLCWGPILPQTYMELLLSLNVYLTLQMKPAVPTCSYHHVQLKCLYMHFLWEMVSTENGSWMATTSLSSSASASSCHLPSWDSWVRLHTHAETTQTSLQLSVYKCFAHCPDTKKATYDYNCSINKLWMYLQGILATPVVSLWPAWYFSWVR